MQVVLYFGVMFVLFWKVRKENTIRRFIFGLYCFSALCSVLYPLGRQVYYEQNTVAYFYFIICNLILLFPIWKFGKVNCTDFEYPTKFIYGLSYFLIIFGIISLINILPQLFTLRTFLNNISEIRSAYYHGEELTVTNSSLIYTLANWVMYIQFLSPTFAFLNFINRKKILALLLCIVSLVPALNKLLIGEREACVVVLSNFIFSYIFFKPVLTKEYISLIKKIGMWFTVPLAIFVIAMTISRFGESEGGVLGGFLAYTGEQPYNFSYFFSKINIDQQNLGGKLSFGYLFNESEQLEGQINEYINAGEYLNVFAGIPGTMLLDFSYSAILIISLLSLLFVIIFSQRPRRVSGKYNFSLLLTLLIYYQIIFMGIFYFDFTSKYVVYMTLILFVVLFFVNKIPGRKFIF